MDLPRWKSHKIVEADKITEIQTRAGMSAWLILAGGHEVMISDVVENRMAKMAKEARMVGGYYVRYEDGYESWSPAKAFEEGYTKIETDAAAMRQTTMLLADWRARMTDCDPLSQEEINDLMAMARRGAGPTMPAPDGLKGPLLGAAWSGLDKVSIEVEPGIRQVWVKGATTKE